MSHRCTLLCLRGQVPSSSVAAGLKLMTPGSCTPMPQYIAHPISVVVEEGPHALAVRVEFIANGAHIFIVIRVTGVKAPKIHGCVGLKLQAANSLHPCPQVQAAMWGPEHPGQGQHHFAILVVSGMDPNGQRVSFCGSVGFSGAWVKTPGSPQNRDRGRRPGWVPEVDVGVPIGVFHHPEPEKRIIPFVFLRMMVSPLMA